MLTDYDLRTLSSNDFQNHYKNDPTLMESLIMRYFSDELLAYCDRMPYYNLNVDAYKLRDMVFIQLFDELEQSNGALRESVLTKLKRTATVMVMNASA